MCYSFNKTNRNQTKFGFCLPASPCSVGFLSVINLKVILVYDRRFVLICFSYLESMHETRVVRFKTAYSLFFFEYPVRGALQDAGGGGGEVAAEYLQGKSASCPKPPYSHCDWP